MGLVSHIREYMAFHGAAYTLTHGMEKTAERLFRTYDRRYRKLQASPAELAYQRANPHGSLSFSFLIPVYNTRPAFLCDLLESLLAQTEPNWEACLYNAGENGDTADILTAYAAKDPRFRVVKADANEGISGNTNCALRMASGEWVILCDHDDVLTDDAVWLVAEEIQRSNPDVVYTDEDKITENGKVHTDEHLKTDFGIDSLRSANFVCHMLAVRRELMVRIGGECSRFDGSQDHDLILRLSEETRSISHVRHICYHWRTVGSSASHTHRLKCMIASCNAVEEHLVRCGESGTAEPDHGVIRIRYEIQRPLSVEILLFGDEKAQERSQRMIEQVNTFSPVRITRLPALPRYQAYNRGAEQSSADVLLFLDASVTGMQKDTIEEMLMYAQRTDVGGVTTTLVTKHGHIRHAGFAYGMKGYAKCLQEGLLQQAGGWHILARQAHNVGAISAACLMVRRDAFLPFDEGYSGGLGSVEWSIRMHDRGYVHVVTPHGSMQCMDRALLLNGNKRDEKDLQRILQSFGDKYDDCWHPCFSTKRADYKLDLRQAQAFLAKQRQGHKLEDEGKDGAV